MAASATPPSTTSSAICASRSSGASRRSRRSSSSATSPSARSDCRSLIKHPAVYMVLIIPFGLVTGFISVTLGYLLGHAGVNAEGIAALVAVSFIPQTWKFLWAPVADLTFTRKRWYAFSAMLCAIGLATLGAVCLACCGALVFIDEPPKFARPPSVLGSIAEVVRDLWHVVRSRAGFLALLICFLPIGTGAATNLWAAIAADWHAPANTVALVSGALGGVASAFGCLVGGYWCDRMDRKKAYWVFGLAQAACMIAMAMSPRTEAVYIGYVLLYAFISGLTYAAFSAVVLEAMGLGAAATKYNLFASLSNMPIAYMTLVDGWAHTRWGAGTMLWAEAAIGAVAVLLFMGMQLALSRPHGAR